MQRQSIYIPHKHIRCWGEWLQGLFLNGLHAQVGCDDGDERGHCDSTGLRNEHTHFAEVNATEPEFKDAAQFVNAKGDIVVESFVIFEGLLGGGSCQGNRHTRAKPDDVGWH